MSDPHPNAQPREWPIYIDSDLLRVAVEKVENEWVWISLRSDPEDTVGVAICSRDDRLDQDQEEHLDEDEGENGCSDFEESAQDPVELARVLLRLRIEEIPRLLAIFNEIYLALCDEGISAMKLDRTGEWGSRRTKIGRLSMTFPLCSRTEPESVQEDLEDRIAVLQAYRIIAGRFREDVGKLGLLAPIG